VLTAGTTVVIGMLGLLVLRQTLLNGVAIAAAATVAMTVLASLTLLPALLGFTGLRLARPSRLNTFLARRVFRGARTPVRSAEKKVHPAERWARVVQGHPVLAAVLAAAVIVILAVPALSIKLSMPDESAQARGTMGYASYATMAQGFGPGFDAPLIVAAKVTSADRPALASLRGAIEGTPGIAEVTPPVISRDGQAALMIAYPTTGEQDAATNALVNRLEDTVLPRSGLTAYLTGPNAANVSFTNLIGERLPLLIGGSATARWPSGGGWPPPRGSSRPPRRSWWWCSCPSTSPRTSRSSRSAWGWPPRCWSTRPWSGWSWSRR